MQSIGPPHAANTVQTADAATLRDSLRYHLLFSAGIQEEDVTAADLARAAMLTIRDLLIERQQATTRLQTAQSAKTLYYLSMEYHLGRALGNILINLGLTTAMREALWTMGGDLDEILEEEQDGALGNGGLARLSACLLDSLATLGLPGHGYGLNYQFGLFRQEFQQGYQQEKPGRWDAALNPWLLARPEVSHRVPVYGRVEETLDRHSRYTPIWLEQKHILATTHDLPISGFGGKTVNRLRLFSARAGETFDQRILDANDYFQAIRQQLFSESITKMLYPADTDPQRLEMRLLQEYFLVSCAISDILRTFDKNFDDIHQLPEAVAIQLNDTNPALAVVELMRQLVDEYRLDWEASWAITTAACSYTCHTLNPDILERWPVQVVERLLPRHLQLIYEINHRFLQEVRIRFADDENAPTRMSLIEETAGRQLNMGHLAIIGSHAVNGVAGQHSGLLRSAMFPDFAAMFPEKFTNVTNGVTQRRWLLKANPELSALICAEIGEDWITRAETLRRLETMAADESFRQRFAAARFASKERLAAHIESCCGVEIDPRSLFDVQIKRVHQQKRQLLHLLHIIHCYRAIVEDNELPAVPRTHIFAGKAAPGDGVAKLVIKLINNVAAVINSDSRIENLLKVVMLPDFNVSLAERIIPAADLSEQLSTAGTEASGTGNMKLMLNGALTIGTMDGANIEMRRELGENDIFIFGLNAAAIEEMWTESSYNPWDIYADSPIIRRAVDCLDSDMFCQEEPGLFRELFSRLMYQGDDYFLLADLQSYLDCQQRVGILFAQPDQWQASAIRNIARAGHFSSDRTVRDYATRIWRLKPPAGE